MRRLFFLLTLSALACGFFTPIPAPSASAPPPADPATGAPSPTLAPPAETPVPMATLRADATRFPDPERFEWVTIAQGLARPVDIRHAGDGSGRLFVAEQQGRIRILQNGQLQFEPFLDITDRVDDGQSEQGLLGLAFHPDFARNGFFYVNYTKLGGDTVIARFTASGNSADPSSEVRLLEVSQPFPNHNGGGLAFGPDGYLYIGLGDGGAGGDPLGTAQSGNSLLGKILRIDVDNGDPYGIPSDNPFAGSGEVYQEVWAYGLRNPWRFSFDSFSGDLWIGDVGQGDYEEVDFVPAGAPGGINFGWSHYEGMHPYNNSAQQENHWPPVFEYNHAETVSGCAVTGGYVYRGAMPEWYGIYFYGDYCTGNIWAALRLVNGAEELFNAERLFELSANISSFGVDEAGELYLVDYSGNILRLERR